MPRQRDTQKAKLYMAERSPSHFQDTHLETFTNAASFGYGIMNSEWFQKRFPGCPRITFQKARANSNSSYAAYYRGVIKLLPAHYSKAVVCHEVAHIAAMRLALLRGVSQYASHGPEFAHIYAGLVAEFIGAREALDLLASFDSKGVSYQLRP